MNVKHVVMGMVLGNVVHIGVKGAAIAVVKARQESCLLSGKSKKQCDRESKGKDAPLWEKIVLYELHMFEEKEE